MYMNKEELTRSLTDAIDYMRHSADDSGCYTFQLTNRLAACVGWSGGYDPKDETCVHSKSDPTCCLNVGLKVWTSDSMRTDYECINAPYYDSGDVWSTDVSIGEDEDVEKLVDYLFAECEAMDRCEIGENGRIENFRSPEDYCSGLIEE